MAGGTRAVGSRHGGAAAVSVGTTISEGLVGADGAAALETALRGSRGDGSGSAQKSATACGVGRSTTSIVFGRSLERTSFDIYGVLFMWTAALSQRSSWRVLAVALDAAGIRLATARACCACCDSAPSSWPSRRHARRAWAPRVVAGPHTPVRPEAAHA